MFGQIYNGRIFGGKRVKGKKGLKMLKAGMECEIGYIGVPVLAKQLKCK